MATNFDKTFEMNKTTFKEKFGINWNENHQLYLTYVQSLYIANIAEILNNGLGEVLHKQDDSISILKNIQQKF